MVWLTESHYTKDKSCHWHLHGKSCLLAKVACETRKVNKISNAAYENRWWFVTWLTRFIGAILSESLIDLASYPGLCNLRGQETKFCFTHTNYEGQVRGYTLIVQDSGTCPRNTMWVSIIYPHLSTLVPEICVLPEILRILTWFMYMTSNSLKVPDAKSYLLFAIKIVSENTGPAEQVQQLQAKCAGTWYKQIEPTETAELRCSD